MLTCLLTQIMTSSLKFHQGSLSIGFLASKRVNPALELDGQCDNSVPIRTRIRS